MAMNALDRFHARGDRFRFGYNHKPAHPRSPSRALLVELRASERVQIDRLIQFEQGIVEIVRCKLMASFL
jgi:hypothetical protein